MQFLLKQSFWNEIRTLRWGVLIIALGLFVTAGVQAQSNTSGAVEGHAQTGDSVTVRNVNTGFARTITVENNGNYRFSALPIGVYMVHRNHETPRQIMVNVGVTVTVNFTDDDHISDMKTMVVTGNGGIIPIDVSSVESSTILTSAVVDKLPVGRNGTAVALLAPGAVAGDSAFGNLASFGGASVSENQYFVNGFNITNTFTNLNFLQVPQEAVAEQQVKTGGYGAEFGRSTGGVLNQITKQGGNAFHAGGNIYYTPQSLRATSSNNYLNDGTLYVDRTQDTARTTTASIWASGALVKDHLFAYGLLQYSNAMTTAYPGVSEGGSNTRARAQDPTYLLKLDWNINSNNLLELTALSGTTTERADHYRTEFADDGAPDRGEYLGANYTESGGALYAFKYTGYLTDTLTLSALVGRGVFHRGNYIVGVDGVRSEYNGAISEEQIIPGCPRVIDGRTPDEQRITGGAYPSCYLVDFLGRPDAQDTRDQYRVDLEWQLGDHLVRGGIDIDRFSSIAGEAYSGGVYWRYIDNATVRKQVVLQGATVAIDQSAFYIEDNWNITDNLVAYFGGRWDNFDNKGGDGISYNTIRNQFAPRFGVSWDIFGDARFKLFGNAGRYALPLTAEIAVRGASASLFTREFFTYTGVDPLSGVPLGPDGQMVGDDEAVPGSFRYVNNEFGQSPNPQTIAAQDLQPMYQDEYILGFEQLWTDHFSGGARLIYRDLRASIDDTCDTRPILAWALEHGFVDTLGTGGDNPPDPENPNQVAFQNPSFPACRLFNPGEDAMYNVDVNGDGILETVPVSAQQSGNAARRYYTALDFFFQGQWDDVFFQGSYTYAKSRGNTEGGVKSDNGQAGTTQDFDYPELGIGAYGYLPNDRRHTFKFYGSYNVTHEWSIGSNLVIQSGRPQSCFGIYGNDPIGYGTAYFSCDPGMAEPVEITNIDYDPGLPVDSVTNPLTIANSNAYFNGTTVVPRGSVGRGPRVVTLDFNVIYRPAKFDGKWVFKVDVFNALNDQEVIEIYEIGENAVGNPIPVLYGRAVGYQSPREIRLSVQYDF